MARIYHTDHTGIDSEVKARVWRLQCTPGISRERRVDEGKHVGSCSHEKWSLSLLLKRLGILTAQLTTPDSAKHHGKSFIYVYSLSSHNPQGGGTITAPTLQMRRLRFVSLESQDLKSFNHRTILSDSPHHHHHLIHLHTPLPRRSCLPPSRSRRGGLVPQFVLLKHGVQGNWGVGGLGGADLRGNCDSSQVAAGKQRFTETGQKFHR